MKSLRYIVASMVLLIATVAGAQQSRLEQGGTEADLSGTGPGPIIQGTVGAPLAPGSVDLEYGGTEADLSSTGPGLVKQGTVGAAISVGPPYDFTGAGSWGGGVTEVDLLNHPPLEAQQQRLKACELDYGTAVGGGVAGGTMGHCMVHIYNGSSGSLTTGVEEFYISARDALRVSRTRRGGSATTQHQGDAAPEGIGLCTTDAQCSGSNTCVIGNKGRSLCSNYVYADLRILDDVLNDKYIVYVEPRSRYPNYVVRAWEISEDGTVDTWEELPITAYTIPAVNDYAIVYSSNYRFDRDDVGVLYTCTANVCEYNGACVGVQCDNTPCDTVSDCRVIEDVGIMESRNQKLGIGAVNPETRLHIHNDLPDNTIYAPRTIKESVWVDSEDNTFNDNIGAMSSVYVEDSEGNEIEVYRRTVLYDGYTPSDSNPADSTWPICLSGDNVGEICHEHAECPNATVGAECSGLGHESYIDWFARDEDVLTHFMRYAPAQADNGQLQFYTYARKQTLPNPATGVLSVGGWLGAASATSNFSPHTVDDGFGIQTYMRAEVHSAPADNDNWMGTQATFQTRWLDAEYGTLDSELNFQVANSGSGSATTEVFSLKGKHDQPEPRVVIPANGRLGLFTETPEYPIHIQRDSTATIDLLGFTSPTNWTTASWARTLRIGQSQAIRFDNPNSSTPGAWLFGPKPNGISGRLFMGSADCNDGGCNATYNFVIDHETGAISLGAGNFLNGEDLQLDIGGGGIRIGGGAPVLTANKMYSDGTDLFWDVVNISGSIGLITERFGYPTETSLISAPQGEIPPYNSNISGCSALGCTLGTDCCAGLVNFAGIGWQGGLNLDSGKTTNMANASMPVARDMTIKRTCCRNRALIPNHWTTMSLYKADCSTSNLAVDDSEFSITSAQHNWTPLTDNINGNITEIRCTDHPDTYLAATDCAVWRGQRQASTASGGGNVVCHFEWAPGNIADPIIALAPYIWLAADNIMTVADGWSVGTTVTPWPNLGIFGSLANGISASNQPDFESNGTNFNGTVVFNGVSDYLDTYDIGIAVSGTTVIVVAKDDGALAGTRAMLSQYKQGSSAGDRTFLMRTTSFGGRALDVVLGNSAGTGDARRYLASVSDRLGSAAGIYGFRYDPGGTSICPAVLPATEPHGGKLELIHRDRILAIGETSCIVDEDATTPPSVAGTHDIRVGATISSAGAVTQYWDGQISEVLTFGKALTDNEFAVVKCYLSNKYALAIAGC